MQSEALESHPGRRPPQDTDAERSVLGAMLLEDHAVAEALGMLKAHDFYRPAHAHIFTAMSALFERGEPLDEITVSAQLRNMGNLDCVGGVAFIASLTETTPTAANLTFYARIVRDRSTKRQIIRAATSIVSSGYEDTGDVNSLLDHAENRIFEITNGRDQRTFSPLKDVVKDAFFQMEHRYRNRGAVTGVCTGYGELDNMTAGLQPSDLIIVAGRPSMGKTAFALGVAQNAAVAHGTPVAVFSLEMSKEQLVQRMICSTARVESQRVRSGMLNDPDWPRLARAAAELSKAPVYIEDSGSLSILELRAKSRRLQAEMGLGLIVVDYLQLMSGRSSTESREREISEISRGLKALAKELKVPVMALSQLNRALEQRQDKRPMLSDLRESGAIEQDADVICFVYRDEYYDAESDDKGYAEIIIGKQRNGPTGTVRLRFLRDFTRFENCSETTGRVGHGA